MAVYKLFPYKDAAIYSYYPDMNSGMDAISEAYNTITPEGTPDVARFLTQFDSTEISGVIDNKINGSSWTVYFNSYVASAQGISTDYNLEIYPVAQNWNNGTGEFLDVPQTLDGISWNFSNFSGSGVWSMNGSIGTELYTGSYDSNYSPQGGGTGFILDLEYLHIE